VGYLRGGKHPELAFAGTGFVIGADLVATADFVVDFLADAKMGTLAGPTVEFVVADAVGGPASAAFKVTEVVALLPATASRSRMAVLRVPGLAVAGYKPLRVSMPATLQPGLNIGVIGYPSFDGRIPQTVLQVVFRNTFGQKRLMVGKLIDKAGASFGEADLFHDAATIGGVGGGPILNLETGEVIGIHLGGTFAESGKSNFGISMATVLPGPTRAQLGL
jgi:endonuclease G